LGTNARFSVIVIKECINQVLVFREIINFADLSVGDLPQQAGHTLDILAVLPAAPIEVAVYYIIIIKTHYNWDAAGAWRFN
jgi:hypothetical protein